MKYGKCLLVAIVLFLNTSPKTSFGKDVVVNKVSVSSKGVFDKVSAGSKSLKKHQKMFEKDTQNS